MKIFVAGASGVIGRLLLPLLVENGMEVTGTTRSPAKLASIAAAGAQPVVVDALDRNSLFAALAEAQPDVVVHLMTDLSDRNFAANSRLRIDGTRNLVDVAKTLGIKRMIAESISWVYAAGTAPADESEALDTGADDPRSRTVMAVQALEQAASELPIHVILRFGLLYGPGTWYAPDGFTTGQVKRGELLAADGVSSFVHVADAARAAYEALNWPTGVYNIVDDEPAAGKEWLPLYANLVGAPEPPIAGAKAGWERGALNTKARAQGWQPRYPTWREGFEAVLT